MKRFVCIAMAVVLLVAGFLFWWTHRRYEPEDFDSIVMGQSDLKDVARIAWCDEVLVTSYGGCTYYPMEDGRWIVVRYTGPEMVVWKIEIMDEPG